MTSGEEIDHFRRVMLEDMLHRRWWNEQSLKIASGKALHIYYVILWNCPYKKLVYKKLTNYPA